MWVPELMRISERESVCYGHLPSHGTNGGRLAFVAARARVAPLKALSIPRLELQAALMGSRLAKSIREEIDVPITEVQFWSDSRTVLWWIRDDSRNYLQFVAHRVGEILETVEPCQWNWVPTKENPADEATRNNGESEFSPSSRWFQGPEFLKLPKENWPMEKEVQREGLEELELKKEFVNMAVVIKSETELHLANRYSSWLKLIR
ncbi:unnamed protein product, partial [Allacma fusca]